MHINNVELERVAVYESQYPSRDLPEIAFAGRSNVGKSSFINSMIRRKRLARTSSKPGKTRTINFYNIENKLRFVDLPGYGYAKVSKSEKEKWGLIIEEYLNNRENLVEVILIVDIRHKPTKDDILMYEWIKHFNLGSIVVATKSDKIKRSQLDKHLKVIQESLSIDDRNKIIPYSSEKPLERDKVWERIEELIK